MPLFTKTDPAERAQRDLEARLKSKRTRHDDMIARRKVAEVAAAEHRDKASALAAEGADDKALSAAENAMRREEDRAATLHRAIATIEAEIAGIEAERALILDHIARVETAGAVNALVDRLTLVGKRFDTVIAEMVEVARESAIVILDAKPLATFLEAVLAQVPAEAALIIGVLESHAKAVLSGAAPASLPAAPDPVEPPVVEKPVTERMFAMRVVKWRDANGVEQLVDQYLDVDCTPSAAANGRRCGALVPIDDPRAGRLRGTHGGRHPNAAHALDLDNELACQLPRAVEPVPLFEPMTNLGPERKLSIAVSRV